jgi:hypothetical protein
MTLQSLIASTPALAALVADPAALLAALNAKTIEKVDHTLVGPAGLALRLPPEIVEAAALSFEAAAQQSATMRLLMGTFSSYGFDFAEQATRDRIDYLVANGMPSAVGTALKSLGIYSVSPAEEAGLGTVTEEQLTEALAVYAYDRLVALVEQQCNATLIAARNGTFANFQAAVTFFGNV